MRQSITRDQMTQTLTTIGHRSAFNNEPNKLIIYTRIEILQEHITKSAINCSEMTKVKQLKQEILQPILYP